MWVKDVIDAANILKKILKNGDLLYLKGSLLWHLERIILLLKGERVECKRVFCHHYQPCTACPDLRKPS